MRLVLLIKCRRVDDIDGNRCEHEQISYNIVLLLGKDGASSLRRCPFLSLLCYVLFDGLLWLLL